MAGQQKLTRLSQFSKMGYALFVGNPLLEQGEIKFFMLTTIMQQANLEGCYAESVTGL